MNKYNADDSDCPTGDPYWKRAMASIHLYSVRNNIFNLYGCTGFLKKSVLPSQILFTLQNVLSSKEKLFYHCVNLKQCYTIWHPFRHI